MPHKLSTMKEEIKCPVCKGRGKVRVPQLPRSLRREAMTVVLLQNGFGIREVQRLVGFKSPNSVLIIKKSIKKHDEKM